MNLVCSRRASPGAAVSRAAAGDPPGVPEAGGAAQGHEEEQHHAGEEARVREVESRSGVRVSPQQSIGVTVLCLVLDVAQPCK